MPSGGGTREVSLRLGGGATGFRSTEADAWVRVPAMAVGGMLRITIAENRSSLVRKDTVVFTPTGGEGEAKNDSLFISQQAIPQTIALSPSVLADVPSGGLTRDLSLRYGGGATGFRRAEADAWVRVPAMAVGGMLRITIAENRSSLVRKDTVVFTPTGGEGEAKNDSLFISQQAIPQTIALSPSVLADVPSGGLTRELSLRLGGGATGFRRAEADTWVRVPAMAVGGMLRITIAENRSSLVRKDTVVFTPTGGEGEAKNDSLFISQAIPQAIPQTITLSPSVLADVPSGGGTREVSLRLGGGATGFRRAEADTWVRVPAMAVGGMLRITIAENRSTLVRKDTVVFTPTGGEGEAKNDSLFISQQAIPQAMPQTITLSPSVLADVPSGGLTREVSLRLGGGATGFRRAEADTWVRVPAMAVGGMLRITIAENRSSLVRKDTVVFTPTGGEGEAKNDSLFISQQAMPQAMPQTIALSPSVLADVPSGGLTRE